MSGFAIQDLLIGHQNKNCILMEGLKPKISGAPLSNFFQVESLV